MGTARNGTYPHAAKGRHNYVKELKIGLLKTSVLQPIVYPRGWQVMRVRQHQVRRIALNSSYCGG